MARLNARWDNFSHRGQVWDHFWHDATSALGALLYGLSVASSSAFGDLTIPRGRGMVVLIPIPTHTPPVGQSLYSSLVERYGEREGQRVWGGMLLERKGPFAEGAKYDPDTPEVAEALVDSNLHPDA
jgi:hypothetical protein